MNNGLLLEISLKKLVSVGDQNNLQGIATALENILGDKKCSELAKFLQELMPKN